MKPHWCCCTDFAEKRYLTSFNYHADGWSTYLKNVSEYIYNEVGFLRLCIKKRKLLVSFSKDNYLYGQFKDVLLWILLFLIFRCYVYCTFSVPTWDISTYSLLQKMRTNLSYNAPPLPVSVFLTYILFRYY